jgi:tetratricopeptide (TPR) repeat protein
MEISQVARMVGVDTKSVQRWISKGRVPHPSHRWKASQILGCEESELWPEISSASTTNAEGNSRLPRFSPLNPLINKNEWTRDDIAALSTSFDDALASSDTADIELLAHAWLYAQTPQLIELSSGSRISDSLISTIEHRIVQLRRADDYMPGHASHLLVRKEISATGLLLKNSNLTDRQAVRLLASIGELAQLAAFIAADIGKYHAAMNYADGGILAAHAANDAPLAANIISTLSYQLANTGDPRRAAMLARTAYAGALRGSTPISKALFLERIAWADAKSGDLDSCMRALDQVEDKFTAFDPDTDPDWVYWLNREEIDVMAGRCFTELKQPAKAVPLLQNAIAAYDSTHIREISLYQSWLAEDFLLLGEIDAASEISSQVLELGAQIDSARTNDRIKHLASLMDSHNDSRAASEFLDRYKTHTS